MALRLFRGILTVAALGIAVVAIFLFALNFYLNLSGTRHSVLTYASAAVGLPIQAEALRANVVKGISLLNPRAANPSSRREGTLIAAPAVTATYAPLALFFQHRLLLHQLILEKPVLSLEQGPDGRLLFPPPDNSPVPTDFFENLRLSIKSLAIEDGSIRVVGSDGHPLLSLDGVQHGGRLERNHGALRASGQFSAQALTLKNLQAANLEGTYAYGDGFFRLSKILGTAYHGQWSGSAQAARNAPALPCDFSLQATSLDLNELLKTVVAQPDVLSGALDLRLTGRATYDPVRATEAWDAQGSFTISNGQLIHVEFVQALAATLGIKDLAQPDFTQCQGDFSVTDGRVAITSFDLKAVNFELASTGPGSVEPDGTLRLPVQLTLLPELSRQLPSILAGQLSPSPGPDGGQILTFILTGTLTHTKVELPERLHSFQPKTPPPAPAPPTPAPTP
ncbi:MAG: AsmA-like C-terminal region-containing protein [Verrucomicrobium sp.]|nr:AsmA-like C-terminal region-containing protein [Verrucomicrobium sp.]